MILDRTQRWILANQYHILAALYPEDADHYIEAREALERGYELHYDWIAQNICEDTMSEVECREVIDILDMFTNLKRSFEKLEDKSGIDEWAVRFSGFDGNTETKWLGYVQYFTCLSEGRFTELHLSDFNSHAPVLASYRRMLVEWKKSSDKRQLTKDDVARIAKARSLAS